MKTRRKDQEYALYKGEIMLSIGTLTELSKEFKVKRETLIFYSSPTYANRTSFAKGRRLVKL